MWQQQFSPPVRQVVFSPFLGRYSPFLRQLSPFIRLVSALTLIKAKTCITYQPSCHDRLYVRHHWSWPGKLLVNGSLTHPTTHHHDNVPLLLQLSRQHYTSSSTRRCQIYCPDPFSKQVDQENLSTALEHTQPAKQQGHKTDEVTGRKW